MIKKLKNAFLLFLITIPVVILTGCGLAEPTSPNENPDKESPTVVSSKPINKGELKYSDNTVSLMLNEAIDPLSLDVLNALAFKSATTNLDGTWTFNDTNNELLFTLTDRDAVAAEQIFKIAINGEITDLAGNALVWNFQVSTPALFDINLTTTGLADGDSLIITHTNKTNSKIETITIDTNNVSTLNANLAKDDQYSLSISQVPSNSFCALSKSSGTAVSSNIDINVECHDVMPVYTDASNWNQYTQDSELKWVHGGEFRTVVFSNLQNCDNITITDSLDAFNWSCEVINQQVRVTSTSLKSNISLSDLINFGSNPGWINNKIIATQGGQVVASSGEGVWWANPVVNANTTTLSTKGNIYLAQEDADLNRHFILNEGVSLLIKPNSTLQSNTNTASISILNKENGLDNSWYGYWLEGDVNAINSANGIQIRNAVFPTLRFTTVKNAKNSGIEINDTRRAKISHVESSYNGSHGIDIVNNSVQDGKSLIENIITSNNTLSGINLSGSDTTLINIYSANNEENGILISGKNNRLIDISSSNNRLDGLVLSGANNNIINSATITSNGVNGVKFGQTTSADNSRYNILSNATIANNSASGVIFDTTTDAIAETNTLINILDAYNAPATCIGSTCNDNKVVSIPDSIFTSASSESNIPDYAPASRYNMPEVIEFSKFDNQYRAWGHEDTAIANTGSGSCNTPAGDQLCKLYDWSLDQTENTIALEQLTVSNSILTHSFFNGDILSFQSNAIEITGDEKGNDNSLCETDEDCIFTPNIGSYQGHGDLTYDGATSLYQYNTNGR